MANAAIRFFIGFLVRAGRGVTRVALGMRRDSQDGRLGVLFVAEVAIELFTGVWKVVSHVQLVLLRVEECGVIVTFREIALGRPRIQSLLCLVADRAGLLWLRGELRDVAFDTSLMAREFQTQFFVAVGRPNNALCQVLVARPFVARIAFQDARVIRPRHIDCPLM